MVLKASIYWNYGHERHHVLRSCQCFHGAWHLEQLHARNVLINQHTVPNTLHLCTLQRTAICGCKTTVMQVVLEVKGEIQLNNLAKKLEGEGVLHKVWVEQPEAYPTALATKPYPKSSIASYFKKLKLCKAQLS